MQTISIDVKNEVVSFVKDQGNLSVSEYVNLMFANQMESVRREEDELERLHELLDEGEASGYIPVDENFFKSMNMRFDAIRKKHESVNV